VRTNAIAFGGVGVYFRHYQNPFFFSARSSGKLGGPFLFMEMTAPRVR
jgi:hypothetical protein